MAAVTNCHPAQTKFSRNVAGHELDLYPYGQDLVVWSQEGQVLGCIFCEGSGYSLGTSLDGTPRTLEACLSDIVTRVEVTRV